MARTTIVPTEAEEQMIFVRWCQLNHILVHHSPLEFASSSRAVKTRAIKMKKMGTSKGFPDLLVFIPAYGVTGEIDSYQMCAVEMKRRKYSTTTKEQKEWLEILNMCGIPSRVCKGAAEAVDFVQEIRKETI